jgi:glutathione synthase/RimK-type ligase-like ATP-grasp enzyme
MLRLLADENFNGDIVRGLLLRRRDLNLVRAQDVALEHVEDSAILAWAAENGRVVLTHDRATMPHFASLRMAARLPMGGLFVVNDRMPVRQAIDDLLLIEACSEQAEWAEIVLYLPL